ncbi:cytidylyltransferase domain-containing protein [Desulfonatronovibrio magnus]|uniref:acylneuraminate cytidylyltransferase family protein n=1 Tax=Desulfonatronovibrio magnus TaxID=698827 RepID=UPI0005EB930A|nr:acylneuraminate cytidylyltransferase family protein [Desulfonatronovibrio magnus]
MIISDQITAILPMKGHSERVSNKNIRHFNGKQLYHHAAQVLQDSKFISSIVINTDSEIISEKAPKHFSKVHIINRPESIRGDFVPMNDIIAHDISVTDGEHFLQTHSTNPLLSQATLERAIQKYFEGLDRYDSLFSVTKLQTRLYWESGKPINHDPSKLERTQDLPPVFEENSNFYIFSRESFVRANNNRIGLTPQMFEVDPLEAIDIDEESDFQLAEAIYHLKSVGKLP